MRGQRQVAAESLAGEPQPAARVRTARRDIAAKSVDDLRGQHEEQRQARQAPQQRAAAGTVLAPGAETITVAFRV